VVTIHGMEDAIWCIYCIKSHAGVLGTGILLVRSVPQAQNNIVLMTL